MVLKLFGSKKNSVPKAPVDIVETTPKDLSNGISGIGWKLLDDDKEKRFFMSPYSIASVLGILANGAENGSVTQKEVLDVLSCKDTRQLNSEYLGLARELEEVCGERAVVKSASLMIVDKTLVGAGAKVDRKLGSMLKSVYNGTVEEADFRNSLEKVKKRINKWVSDSTDGFIEDFESAADENTAVDVLNAVYFKAAWESVFDRDDTEEEDFTDENGNTVKIPLMHRSFNFGTTYYDDGRYSGLCLRYRCSGNLSMCIVVPSDHGTDVRRRWCSESVEYRNKFIGTLQHNHVDNRTNVYFPRFAMGLEYYLMDALKRLGVVRALTGLTEVTQLLNGIPLKVDAFRHQAKIEVDEEGTVAAAVTEMIMTCGCALGKPLPEITFRCDIPFVFTISGCESAVPLFVGYFGGPEERS
ncbi:MAG: hypothetical protein IJ856_01260 [Candidatus Methanomethylophilaceae archaeon]|nr:hypothetical protein [Candidatus Methanomethylophilaceae archaeon]